MAADKKPAKPLSKKVMKKTKGGSTKKGTTTSTNSNQETYLKITLENVTITGY